jgi:carbon-monoxide dehydrogenase medium subunit
MATAPACKTAPIAIKKQNESDKMDLQYWRRDPTLADAVPDQDTDCRPGGTYPVRYERPETIQDAAALLAAAKDPAFVLAGGTDLLVRMQRDDFDADLIVDIKSIAGMGDITETDDAFVIGAAVPCAALSENAALIAAWPGVVEAANLIGSTQIQGRCTIAGNLCNASPAADSVPSMVAADARVRITGPNGTREASVLDIPKGPGKTSLAKGEIIEAVVLTKPGPRSGDAYLRFIPRTEMDIAVVGVGVNLALDEGGTVTSARIALGAVGPTVVLVKEAADALVGTKLEDGALDALAAACSAASTPINDKRGTVAFRKKVAGVLARRAAQIAYTRAGGK